MHHMMEEKNLISRDPIIGITQLQEKEGKYDKHMMKLIKNSLKIKCTC